MRRCADAPFEPDDAYTPGRCLRLRDLTSRDHNARSTPKMTPNMPSSNSALPPVARPAIAATAAPTPLKRWTHTKPRGTGSACRIDQNKVVSTPTGVDRRTARGFSLGRRAEWEPCQGLAMPAHGRKLGPAFQLDTDRGMKADFMDAVYCVCMTTPTCKRASDWSAGRSQQATIEIFFDVCHVSSVRPRVHPGM